MAISSKVQQRFLEQDDEFWDAVFDVCRLVVPFDRSALGAPQQVIDTAPGMVGMPRMRLIYPLQNAPHSIQRVVSYFDYTPYYCYPCGNLAFACEMRTDPPMPIGYIDPGQLRMVLSYLLGGSGIDAAVWVEQTDRLYKLWLDYLRRHYNRDLKGASLGIRLGLAEETCRERYGKFLRLRDFELLDGTLTCRGRSISRLFLEQTLERKSGLEDAVAYLRLLQQHLQMQPKLKPQETSRQPCFVYQKGGLAYTVYFDDAKKEFSCRQGEPQVSLPFIIDADRASEDMMPPFDALYGLTGGDVSLLEDLAKCAAYSLSAEKMFGGAIILPAELSYLMFYILRASVPEEKLKEYADAAGDALSFFAKSKAKDSLINHKLSRAPFLLCRDDDAPIKPDGRQRLKKLMNGSLVTYRDAILREKRHRNTAQWLIAGDDRTAAKLKRYGIPYLQPKLCVISGEQLISLRSGWMSLVLPLWGMMLIKRQTRAKVSDDRPRGLSDFVRECCEISKRDGEFLPARALYDAYAGYCGECGCEPLLFKDFNRALEEDFGLKRTRRHVSSGSNVTGYRRIALAEERTPVDGKAVRYEEFCRVVEGIRDEVFAAVEGLFEF